MSSKTKDERKAKPVAVKGSAVKPVSRKAAKPPRAEDVAHDAMELTMRDASAPSVLRPREFAKSSKTRLRILESAVQCLVEVGYAKMSTGLVAARAKIARSALQYHFPTRHDLVVALVRHVHYERSRKYAEEITAAGAREGAAVDIYWQHVQGRLFVAYSELHFAARTDRELSEIIEPVFLEYERDRVEISRRIYPELWSQKPQAFDLYRDVTRFLVEGMALSTIAYRRQERVAGVLEFVKATRRNLMAEAAEPKAPAGEPAAKPKRLRKANR